MSEDFPKSYFKVLNNEMRRQIVQHLEREKTATFTQIMNLLELDPLWQCGTIGYHLKLLVDSGVVRKFEDGYVLTSRGRSLADLINKIEYSEGSEKMNRCEASEEVLGKLHPRFVCWLLAVAKGVKPGATILSVAKENWTGFVEVLKELDLCWSYKGINGMVLSCQGNEAGRLLGHLSTKSDRNRVNFLFDDENWAKFLYDAKSSSQVLSPSSAKSTPVIQQDLDVRDIVVAGDLESLVGFARFNQRIDKPACWSNHIERGKALGYPDCCIEAYDKGGKIGLVARRHFFKELIDLELDEKMPVEFWAVAHVPCSAKCKESINLGKRYLGAVKSYSSSLYDSVLKRLRVSYIAYSVGERFLGFTEIPQEHLPLELGKEYSRILNLARKLVSEDVKLTLGNVQRPLVYVDWESYPARCRLIPDLIGLKWIAYSPGEGMLIRDVKTDEIYLYGMLKWMLPNEYEDIMDTVCRVYKCQ